MQSRQKGLSLLYILLLFFGIDKDNRSWWEYKSVNHRNFRELLKYDTYSYPLQITPQISYFINWSTVVAHSSLFLQRDHRESLKSFVFNVKTVGPTLFYKRVQMQNCNEFFRCSFSYNWRRRVLSVQQQCGFTQSKFISRSKKKQQGYTYLNTANKNWVMHKTIPTYTVTE